MTISTIEIELFQPHKLTIIEPALGFTVITGSSRNGKTSIARALKWAIENQPRGAEFKSWFAEEGDETRVALGFEEESFIMRAKSNKMNSYTVSTYDKPLKAVRSDVPEEVSAITRMSSINIQSQHDPYFMLQPPFTPGEIGRMFNEAVGLEIIDVAIQEVNGVIRKAKGDLDFNKGEKERLEKEFSQFANLHEIESLLAIVTEKLHENVQTSMWINKAGQLVSMIGDVEFGIKTMDKELEIKSKLPLLLDMISRRDKEIDNLDKMYQIIEAIELTESKIQKLDTSLEIIPIHEELLRLIQDTEKLRSDVSTLRNVLRDIYNIDRRLQDETDALNDKKSELSELISEIQICPFCQQPLPDDFHMEEHI